MERLLHGFIHLTERSANLSVFFNFIFLRSDYNSLMHSYLLSELQ